MKQENLDTLRNEYQEASMSEKQRQDLQDGMMKARAEEKRMRRMLAAARGIAAAAAVFVILPNTSAGVAHAMSGIPVVGKIVEAVTFRDYRYEDERHMAEVEVPELVVKEDETLQGTIGETEGKDETLQEMTEGTGGKDETLRKTTEEINQEIEEITGKIIAEFEENLKYEEGYQDVVVKSEVISTTETYFTLKLICYQGAGSGAQWNYFYTIDLNSGKRLALKDLFKEGADYITPISDSIKAQMREQMAADENIYYWLEDEMSEWNFRQITEETSFYVNQDGNVVIAFNEGDVAPMYMGCVEFVIPEEVLRNIRK